MNIPVLTLPGLLPSGTVISAAELAGRVDIERMRAQAAADLAQAREAADSLREAALHAAEEEVERLRQEARDTAVAEAVQWVHDECELEQRIAHQLAIRWRGLTASVLDRLLGTIDQNELLLRRVEQEVAELLPHGRLTLYMQPAALLAATRTYAERPEITLLGDEELGPGQARLDNGLVRISLDERAYRARLLRQLAEGTEG
ncbi:hypothetical protein [Burkholderia lata]|uniref:hypothetical protein n=1 Tax=Burkholderia lata (strain ATCC 17760 / DSM 23089 / LMG 22485 / NCIMB 9086 / R18194 / 383) TaxID=482957 RepID=UPI001583C0B0|nr:hypothetical protein [Burkholderia lata]